jgi:ATP:ADP antiporter, AAA family
MSDAPEPRSGGPASAGSVTPLTRLFQFVVDARPGEIRSLFLGAAYYFTVLTAYYILRPIREEMGVAGGVANLPWLFTGTLGCMILLNPLYSTLVARVPRRRFIPLSYWFFMMNLAVFFVLLKTLPESANVWIGRVFFVWVSVFNLFVVSIFWSFMTDVFRHDQGKRLFAFVALGGTIGAVLGSSITAFFARLVGTAPLLLISIGFLQLGIFCARGLGRSAEDAWDSAKSEANAAPREKVIGGGALAGIAHLLTSPYLLGIASFMMLFTIGSTFLYVQQAALISAIADRAVRTALFARIDLMVNLLTIVFQSYLTAKLMKWLGLTITLALLPALSVVGFLSLGFAPTIVVLVAFQVVRRACDYGVTRPAREVLYTVVSREDKYKAKNLIDTFVYRAGDQIGAWTSAGLTAAGLGVAGSAFVGAPIAGIWFFVALWLGRRQDGLAKQQDAERLGAAA